MDINNKLQSFRGKIESATILNKEFGNLVGIQLFDFIQENGTLRDEMKKRVEYLHDLAESGDFTEIQDKLIKSTLGILKEIPQNDVSEAQKIFRGEAIYVYFKGASGGFARLDQLYKFLSKKESYYKLGEEVPYHNSDEGDLMHAPSIALIREQYNRYFETLLKMVCISRKVRGEKNQQKFETLLENYRDTFHSFDDKIYAEPIKLHVADFESIFLFSMSAYKRKGYEDHYEYYHSALYEGRHRPYKLESLKRSCLQVIDDLCEIVSSEGTGALRGKAVTQFDETSGVLEYRKERHVFQTSRGDKALPFQLFKLLWGKRKMAQGGSVTKKGDRRQHAYYAVQIGVIQEMSSYGKNKKLENKFKSVVKGIQKILKKFPSLTLETAGGILLCDKIT